MSFSNITANLKLNINNFAANLSDAAKQMRRFARTTNQAYGNASLELGRHNLQLKDTARIVQGILVSQAFYGITRAISEAASTLMDFNEKLDYAKVTYTALFGSASLAEDFSTALQNKAVETIFDYDTLADASKKMLAYGIKYENLMYIMNGITKFGAMSGDAAAMDRIALAIGQIATRGTLKAEEMRQLANAYVPIYDIIQSKFGLSAEDMGRVGDLGLPAHEVINAIVEYANDTFGGVEIAAMNTITGLKNRIVDSMKILGSEMTAPLTEHWKTFLKWLADETQTIRELFQTGGWGGIFEYLVPDPATQTVIRSFFANIHNLITALGPALHAAANIGQIFAQAMANAFNLIAPVLIYITGLIAKFLRWLTDTSAAAYVLRVAIIAAAGALAVMALQSVVANVIAGITAAVYGLARAFMFLSVLLSRNWLLGGLAILAIGLVSLAGAANNAGNSMKGVFDGLSGMGGGLTSGDIFKNTTGQLNDGADAADAFNNALTGSADSAEDLEDAVTGAGNAAKKAKAGLLSFDEVFKLNENASSGGGGAGGGMDEGFGNFGSGGMPSLLGAGMAEIGSSIAANFVDALKNSLLGKLAAAGIGAAVSGAIFKALADPKFIKGKAPLALKFMNGIARVLLGASVGLAFDALASLITDKIWDALSTNLKLSDNASTHATIGASIGSVVGGAIGMLVGGLPGSLIGSAIGHLAGGIVGLLWEEISGAFNNTAVGLFAGMAPAIAKLFSQALAEIPKAFASGGFSGVFRSLASMFTKAGLKAVAKGGIIGMAVGFVVDGIAALLWNWLADKFSLGESAEETAKVGQTIGGVLGTVIGGLLGGPVGAVIGSAIGTFAGGFVGLFWEKIVEFFKPVTSALMEIVTILSESFFSLGVNIGEWAGSTWESLSGWFTDTVSGFTTWWNDTFAGLSQWWDDTVALFSDWDSINGETLGTWWEDTKEGFTTWISDTFEDLSNWFDDTVEGFGTWASDTYERFSTWSSDTKQKIKQWKDDTIGDFIEWAGNVLGTITNWAYEAGLSIGRWVHDTATDIGTWVTNTVQSIGKFATEAARVIGGFVIASAKSFGKWVLDSASSVGEWGLNLMTSIGKWVSDTGAKLGTWLNQHVWTPIANFFSIDNMWQKLKQLFDQIKEKIAKWWKDAVENIFSGNFTLGLDFTGQYTRPSTPKEGHAVGGVFNREHVARFAEGNKAEAIIPLETESAMQPFVNAVSNGLVETLAPLLAQTGQNSGNDMPPLYVGTLIADDRGIKQLYDKFEVIRLQENARKGWA